jgi:RNA polymerase sigma factor (sigma-70 family)
MGDKHLQFEELLLTHLDGAYNLAFWLTQNRPDAQAIVEEAYLQAMREFGKLRETHIRVWLLTIVLRITHTWLQKQGRQSRVVLPAPNDCPDTAEAPAHAAKTPPDTVQNESVRHFFDVLSRLPVEFREILVLHEVEGWSYRQLAVALETTRDTITTRLHVARRSLREKLGEPRSS